MEELKKITLTRRIELFINEESEKREECRNLLNYLDNTIYKLSNEVMTNIHLKKVLPFFLLSHYKDDLEKYKNIESEISTLNLFGSNKPEIKKRVKELRNQLNEIEGPFKKRIDSEFENLTKSTATYHYINSQLPKNLSILSSSLSKKIENDYKNNYIDLVLGKRSLNTYKKGMSIPFNIRKELTVEPSNWFIENDKGYYIISLFGYSFGLKFGRDRSNNRAIVKKLIDKEPGYKLCDSSIKIDGKKIFLNLSFSQEIVEKTLDDKKVMGIDLGVNTPICLAINTDSLYKCFIGDNNHFINHKTQYRKVRRSLQKNLKINNGGKGRKKKLSKLEDLSNKEKNWTDTEQHKLSSQVIKEALKNNCKTIQMENLKNFNNNNEEFKKFIVSVFGYHGIQTKIEYKAKMHGINVVYVNPKNTSITCSCCGEIGTRDKEKFICSNIACEVFEKNIHADYNAAKNISKSFDFKEK